jgi:hypothetical protein
VAAYDSCNIFFNYLNFYAGRSKPTYAVLFTPRPYKACDVYSRCLEIIVTGFNFPHFPTLFCANIGPTPNCHIKREKETEK